MKNESSIKNQSMVDSLFLKVNHRLLSLGEKVYMIKILQRSELGEMIPEKDLNFLRDMGQRARYQKKQVEFSY